MQARACEAVQRPVGSSLVSGRPMTARRPFSFATAATKWGWLSFALAPRRARCRSAHRPFTPGGIEWFPADCADMSAPYHT